MSNHIHLCVKDETGEVSSFMQYFEHSLARNINALDGAWGSLFDGRFSEIAIVDEAILIERIAYAVANPSKANLVRTYKDWTGVCCFASAGPTTMTFSRLLKRKYATALSRAARSGRSVDRAAYCEASSFEVAGVGEHMASRIREAIAQHEAAHRKAEPNVLGMNKVLELSPFDAPKESKRTRKPLCFASTRDLCQEFVDRFRAFVNAFREASHRFRAGVLDAKFPLYSFRPCTAVT
jgi:hypothetical protein